MNVWKCKLIFTTLQQKIEITDLKPFLAAENISDLIILPTTVSNKAQSKYEIDISLWFDGTDFALGNISCDMQAQRQRIYSFTVTHAALKGSCL